MASQVFVPDLYSTAAPELFLVRQPALKRLPKLLSIENDQSLLSSRSDVLAKAGCRVRSCTALGAFELIRTVPFKVIVFGHSLSNAECGELAISARMANAGAKLLLLQAFEPRWTQVEQLFDAALRSLKGPAALVQEVERLLAIF